MYCPILVHRTASNSDVEVYQLAARVLMCRRWGNRSTSFYGLFINATQKAYVFAIDTVATNLMGNISQMYKVEYKRAYVDLLIL